MSMSDTINLQVHDVVGADVHGDAGVYTLQSGAQVPGKFERVPETTATEFGDTERDYNLLVLIVSKTLVAQPHEVGRPGAGDGIVFGDEPAVTWYVRQIVNHGRAGGYHRLLCADYNGPIDGM